VNAFRKTKQPTKIDGFDSIDALDGNQDVCSTNRRELVVKPTEAGPVEWRNSPTTEKPQNVGSANGNRTRISTLKG
jgi:hypothetical protein